MTIKRKLWMINLALLAVSLVILGVFYLLESRMDDADRREFTADRIVMDISDLDSLTYGYMLNPGERVKQQWESKHAAIAALIARAAEGAKDDKIIERIRKNYEEASVTFKKLVDTREKRLRASPGIRALLDDNAERFVAQMIARSQMMAVDTQSLIHESNTRIRQARFLVLNTVAGVIVIMTAIGFALSYFIGRGIAGSIQTLKEGTQVIAGGDLNHRIGLSSGDEIGELADAFDRMTEQLQATTVSRDDLAREVVERKRAQAELNESRRRLSVIVDSIADGFYALDRQWRITHINDAALNYFNRTREDMVGRTIFEVFSGFRGSIFETGFRRAMESAEPAHLEAPSVDTDRTVEIHAYPGLENMTILFRDVTERSRMTVALRESEARFRLLSETAGRLLGSENPHAIVEDLCLDVMAHLDCQAFFNFIADERTGKLRLNACAGIPEEEVRKLERLDSGVAVCGCGAGDQVRLVAEDIFHTPDARTELVKSFGIQAYCCHPLKAEGRLIGTLSFGTKTRPHFTPEEVELMRTVTDQVAIAMARTRAVEALQDTRDHLEIRVRERTAELEQASRALEEENAERRHAEEALRRANLYTRSLIEASLDPLVTVSADGKVTDVNHATEELAGLSREKIIGTDFSDYFTEPEKARTGYEEVFSKGFVRDYPLAVRHASGRITEVLYNATTYVNENGEIQGAFAAARDVTELRRAQDALQKSHDELERRVEERTKELKERTAQLEEANKELEGFSYSVSHDLRAPLRAIDGFSRMIVREEEKLEGDTKRKLNVIRDNVQKMGQLIDDLLAFSRLGRQAMTLSVINVEDLVNQVWKECYDINPERRMELRIDALPSAFGDRALVRQVFSNLLSNAVKFTTSRKNAVIEVGGRGEGSEKIYYVKDNGVGFDMRYCDKLFGVFQRLHRVSEYEGTGVGLAIVQRIIHRHGGRVWAEGKENEGATFYFTLPGK